MAPVPWTTDEQKKWLTKQLPEYHKCSDGGSFSKFWPLLYEGFHQRWPEQKILWLTKMPTDLTEAQKKELGNALQKRQKVSIRLD